MWSIIVKKYNWSLVALHIIRFCLYSTPVFYTRYHCNLLFLSDVENSSLVFYDKSNTWFFITVVEDATNELCHDRLAFEIILETGHYPLSFVRLRNIDKWRIISVLSFTLSHMHFSSKIFFYDGYFGGQLRFVWKICFPT